MLIEDMISSFSGERKKLLLHVCCAPCASAVIERLYPYFDLTLYFYNPNITDEDEYAKRFSELVRYNSECGYGLEIIDGGYSGEDFFKAARGLENEPERGGRCRVCFGLRMQKTAFFAKESGFSFFATTLTVSPHKDAAAVNLCGEQAAERAGTVYLASDFKKKNGYARSIQLSREHGLYRQNFCGCIFSKAAAAREGRA